MQWLVELNIIEVHGTGVKIIDKFRLYLNEVGVTVDLCEQKYSLLDNR